MVMALWWIESLKIVLRWKSFLRKFKTLLAFTKLHTKLSLKNLGLCLITFSFQTKYKGFRAFGLPIETLTIAFRVAVEGLTFLWSCKGFEGKQQQMEKKVNIYTVEIVDTKWLVSRGGKKDFKFYTANFS